MSHEQFIDIWREKHRLWQERSKEMERRMVDYDAEFDAKLDALMKRCALMGHQPGPWQSNGLGNSFLTCNACRATIERHE